MNIRETLVQPLIQGLIPQSQDLLSLIHRVQTVATLVGATS